MGGNEARVWVLAVAVGFLTASVAAAAVPLVSGSAGSPSVSVGDLPPRTGVRPVNFTLHGNQGLGWGFTNKTIKSPGPNLTVHFADSVFITLIANDSAPHNWFIDYNNDSSPSPGEPSSPDFNVPLGRTVTFNFTADTAGPHWYRCRIHPESMAGIIYVIPEPQPVNLTLYGNQASGWGYSNRTIHLPGPFLVVAQGTNVTLHLIANDTAPHNWFIDYNNDSQPNGGEPSSPDFNNPVGSVIVYSFIADRTGNYTYRCHVHPPSMWGHILILGPPSPPPPQGVRLPLISEIMLGALGLVLVFAAVYHVRAVRAAKRTR